MHTTSYNPAHDKAQLLARRHERDLHWAKERRRQHEREAAEARATLAARPLRLARACELVRPPRLPAPRTEPAARRGSDVGWLGDLQ